MKGDDYEMVVYTVNLSKKEVNTLNVMKGDEKFWASNIAPHSISQIISWAVEDYIDSYRK